MVAVVAIHMKHVRPVAMGRGNRVAVVDRHRVAGVGMMDVDAGREGAAAGGGLALAAVVDGGLA